MSNPGGGDSLGGKKKTTWFQLSSPRGHGGSPNPGLKAKGKLGHQGKEVGDGGIRIDSDSRVVAMFPEGNLPGCEEFKEEMGKDDTGRKAEARNK